MQVGAHTIEEDGDLVIATSRGDWSLDQINVLIATWDRVRATHGRLYYLGDFSGGMGLSAAVRKRAIDWGRHNQFDGLVLVITSVTVRALALLVVRATTLLRRDSTPPQICTTLAEARAVMQQLRSEPKQHA